MSEPVVPVTLTVGDQIVFSGNIYLAKLLAAFGEKPGSNGMLSHKSYPISSAQAEQLLRRVDKKSAVFLKILTQNGGRLDFASMMTIFGITKWTEFSGSFGKGITRALRYMTGNTSANLIWRNDEEWDSENDPNGIVYIDGQALKSLETASGTSAG